MKINVSVGTKIKVKTNPELGILTVNKIDKTIDAFGDKTGLLTARMIDSRGMTRAMTPVDQITSEYFEVVK